VKLTEQDKERVAKIVERHAKYEHEQNVKDPLVCT